jgi:hypothetical protein
MKLIALSAALAICSTALAQDVSLETFRAKIPQLYGLDDESAVKVIQSYYYPEIPVERIASRLGVVMSPPPPPKQELGMIDKWRYQSCQQDAATAPTQSGINIKMRVCREKFGQ